MIHTLTFPRVLRHIYTKLNDVTWHNFTWWAFLRSSTQSLTINKGTITTFSVLKIELWKQTKRIQVKYLGKIPKQGRWNINSSKILFATKYSSTSQWRRRLMYQTQNAFLRMEHLHIIKKYLYLIFSYLTYNWIPAIDYANNCYKLYLTYCLHGKDQTLLTMTFFTTHK